MDTISHYFSFGMHFVQRSRPFSVIFVEDICQKNESCTIMLNLLKMHVLILGHCDNHKKYKKYETWARLHR